MITLESLKKFCHDVDYDALLEAVNHTLDKFNINTPRRTRYFMTHTHVESQGYMKFSENMRYSTAARLVAVWPRRMTLNLDEVHKAYAYDYVNQPEKLGNFIYAGRNGNGDEASGDGFRYRARGGLGLTGKANYLAASMGLYGDDRLVTNPELVEAFGVGMETAGWFWDSRKLNELADADSFSVVTRVINGSEATVPERLSILHKANLIF